jgi:hypothetical protein
MFKREAQPEEPAPDYNQWEQDLLKSVFPLCNCGRPTFIVNVPPAPRGEQIPEPLCEGHAFNQ